MKGLHELFVQELHLLYDGEKQIVEMLPGIIDAASSKRLKEALGEHLEETKKQVRRLEVIFKELHQSFSEMRSQVMESLLKEAGKVIQSDYEASVKDVALINCIQHIEHFEIASYGILKSLAKDFNYDNIYNLLDESSDEEGLANKTLTKIAEGNLLCKGVNTKASETEELSNTPTCPPNCS